MDRISTLIQFTGKVGAKLDPVNGRGDQVLSASEARLVLPGFELNRNAGLSSLVPISARVDEEQKQLRVMKIGGQGLALADVYQPVGSTDVQLQILVARLNLDPEGLDILGSTLQTVELTQDPQEVVVPFELDPDPEDFLVTMGAVAVKFYQKVNNQLYELQNGTYDSAQIVALR